MGRAVQAVLVPRGGWACLPGMPGAKNGGPEVEGRGPRIGGLARGGRKCDGQPERADGWRGQVPPQCRLPAQQRPRELRAVVGPHMSAPSAANRTRCEAGCRLPRCQPFRLGRLPASVAAPCVAGAASRWTAGPVLRRSLRPACIFPHARERWACCYLVSHVS